MRKKQTIFEDEPQPKASEPGRFDQNRRSHKRRPQHDAIRSANEQKFNRMANRGDRLLLHAKAIFPFDLFPDEIVIDLNKITYVNYSFFFNKFIRSILVKDLANVNVSTSIFFATLKITDQYFTRDPVIVEYLSRGNAIKARRIISGLMVANQEKIDFSRMGIDEIRTKLIEIGRIREESAP